MCKSSNLNQGGQGNTVYDYRLARPLRNKREQWGAPREIYPARWETSSLKIPARVAPLALILRIMRFNHSYFTKCAPWVLLLLTHTAIKAQPHIDLAHDSLSNAMVIIVVETEEGCEVNPGIFQLTDDGYSKITSLTPLNYDTPYLAYAKNSKQVLHTLNTIGGGRMRVKSYDEFLISDCAKESVYILVEASSAYMENRAQR